MEIIKRDDTVYEFIPGEDVFLGYEPADSNLGLDAPSQIGSKLGLDTLIAGNVDIEVMARSVDRFVRDGIQEDSMKGSQIAFERGLQKLIDRVGVNMIDEIERGQGLKLLERLFNEVSLQSKLSGQTNLKNVKKELKKAKIDYYKKQIKNLLK